MHQCLGVWVVLIQLPKVSVSKTQDKILEDISNTRLLFPCSSSITSIWSLSKPTDVCECSFRMSRNKCLLLTMWRKISNKVLQDFEEETYSSGNMYR